MRQYNNGNEYHFDDSLDNPNVFYRLETGDLKLIRYCHFRRGDVFCKQGVKFLVRWVDEDIINYGHFSVLTKQMGGGGAIHSNIVGANSQCIVEYVGYYQYKQQAKRTFAAIQEDRHPKPRKPKPTSIGIKPVSIPKLNGRSHYF